MPPSIYKELRQIKKWERSAPNRLKSIEEDAVRCDGLLTSLCCDVWDAWEDAEERRIAKAAKTAKAKADEEEAAVPTVSSSSAPALSEEPSHSSCPQQRPCPLKVRCFANLRCGEWYLPSHSAFRGGCGLPGGRGVHLPEGPAGVLWGAPSLSGGEQSPNVYFKSADSHYGKWQFSAVRLNLQLLQPYLQQQAGEGEGGQQQQQQQRVLSVIVDATQQGKRFPDALAKTVPIWCLVVNEALYYSHDASSSQEGSEAEAEASRALYFERARALLPPSVPDSEVNSISLLLPSFVELFKKQLALSGFGEARRLARPLRPVWVSCADEAEAEEALGSIARRCVQRCGRATSNTTAAPTTNAVTNGAPSADVDTIVLMCASGDTTKVRPRAGWFYVTGGADDHETWGRGLTPNVFWDNVGAILHPNGPTAPMPADVIISARMQEAIDAHAERCRRLAAGEGDGSSGEGGAASSEGRHRWFPISSRVVVHCGPLQSAVAARASDGGRCHFLAVGPGPSGSDTAVAGCVAEAEVEADDAAVGGSAPLAHVREAVVADRVLFDVSNKTGLQRAAFALFVAASRALCGKGEGADGDAKAEEGEDADGEEATLVLSVAIAEHMPVLVAVLALLMTLMTTPERPDAMEPLKPIVQRIASTETSACEAEEEGEECSLIRAISVSGGAVSEAIAAAAVTKEWIRSCHQRASTLCGGATAPRSLMQQINQYFLTMDSFGKNQY